MAFWRLKGKFGAVFSAQPQQSNPYHAELLLEYGFIAKFNLSFDQRRCAS